MSTIKMTVEVSAETAWKIIDLMTAEEAITANKAQPMAAPAPQQPITAAQQFGAAPIPTPVPMPATAPTATAAQQFSAPMQNAPVYNAAPTAAPMPSPAPVIPSNAPTSAPMYSIAQLQTACGPLADSGKLPELQKLIASFGVNSLAELPQARYGEFANGLRALGGVL